MISMSQIIGYCMSRLSEKLTIADISHSLFLDKTYVSKLFKEKLGMNFTEFINRQLQPNAPRTDAHDSS